MGSIHRRGGASCASRSCSPSQPGRRSSSEASGAASARAARARAVWRSLRMAALARQRGTRRHATQLRTPRRAAATARRQTGRCGACANAGCCRRRRQRSRVSPACRDSSGTAGAAVKTRHVSNASSRSVPSATLSARAPRMRLCQLQARASSRQLVASSMKRSRAAAAAATPGEVPPPPRRAPVPPRPAEPIGPVLRTLPPLADVEDPPLDEARARRCAEVMRNVDELSARLAPLTASPPAPVSLVYDAHTYARAPYERYVRRYGGREGIKGECPVFASRPLRVLTRVRYPFCLSQCSSWA
jgi:hypothetical protein